MIKSFLPFVRLHRMQECMGLIPQALAFTTGMSQCFFRKKYAHDNSLWQHNRNMLQCSIECLI